jgi:hypothetical protein
MPRVLLLARHFPPIGGAGVHRSIGSVRHLPEHGYEPVVITGPGHGRGRWDRTDPGLVESIPAGAEVHRLDGAEPAGRTGLASRVDQLREIQAPWVRWWIEESVRLGREVGADADVVLTSCAPYDVALAGARLAAELGKPWVADLEDPWALDEMRLYPTALHRSLDLRRMRSALRTASSIVMAAPEAAVRTRAAIPALARLVTSVPIGFEPDDFTGVAPERDDGAFRIVHTGSMHTALGMHLRGTRMRRRLLGGTFPGVEILTRSHVYLVEAIAGLVAAEPSLAGRIELHLAGELTEADRAVAERHSFVRTPGLLPHVETVKLMRSADLLFLPMHDLPAGTRAGLIPYKTYEYLAAERPILAAVPDGDVRDMLAPLEHVRLVRPSDVAGMTAALRAQIDAGLPARVEATAARRYERGRCVAGIAAVLDGVLDGSRPAALAA